jgi:hypothetical protein
MSFNVSGVNMHVLSHYTAADAAEMIDPRGRAIALSVVLPPGPCC